jgi:spermidine synthase
MALLPYVLHPNPEDALMITFGAGISAGLAVHLYSQVECVELNETCTEIARYFRRENRDVLAAANLTLHINDGRSFLRHTDKHYAAIVSDDTHPHSYDSWILFTREFYELCARCLDARGIFCQWLPLHGLAPRQFRTILSTVRQVFPEATLWTVDRAYCLMIAGKEPLVLDPHRLAAVLNRKDLRPFLNPVGLDNPYAVLNAFVAGPHGLNGLLSDEDLINTDDRPYNQFFPVTATGFGRLRWPLENLHQLMRHEENVRSIIDRQ